MVNRWKVLVAECEIGASAGLATTLRELGCEVVFASDAVGVLTMALRHRPQAVLLGPRLPAGGPLLALRRLRSSVHTAGIPVLALADPGPDNQALLAAGVEDCLDLPVDTAELVAALEARMNVGRAVQGAPVAILNEPRRLAALQQTGLLDSPPAEEFDALTRLAARLLHTPVALVSLVDGARQFFKSQIGLPQPWSARRQTPLSHSFCQWVVSSESELAVSDARIHPVLRTNRAIADLGVVAYAGVPLSAMTGETIGSFCAIDGKPRNWTRDELATLRDLGQIVSACSALDQVRQQNREGATDKATLVSVARANASGFVAAARLLGRHGDDAEARAILIGIVERHGHELIETTDTSEAHRAAA